MNNSGIPQPRHGHTRILSGGRVWKSPTYHSWVAMNDRCYRERHKWFDAYGGRGIEVCLRWRRGEPNAFTNFLADMGARPDGLTLDRIDVNGNYELHKADGKLQCKWSTKSEQRLNQRAAEQKNGNASQGRSEGGDSERIGDIPY